MKTRILVSCLAASALLASTAVLAVDAAPGATASETSRPTTFVKDSTITTKVKVKLAAEQITSLGNIHVDTDKDGIVWLSGSAGTKEAADKAVAIAEATEGVKSVRSDIKVDPAK
jgi:hyperosmotically inducible protein